MAKCGIIYVGNPNVRRVSDDEAKRHKPFTKWTEWHLSWRTLPWLGSWISWGLEVNCGPNKLNNVCKDSRLPSVSQVFPHICSHWFVNKQAWASLFHSEYHWCDQYVSLNVICKIDIKKFRLVKMTGCPDSIFHSVVYIDIHTGVGKEELIVIYIRLLSKHSHS